MRPMTRRPRLPPRPPDQDDESAPDSAFMFDSQWPAEAPRWRGRPVNLVGDASLKDGEGNSWFGSIMDS
ncbi:hypothetical protein BURC_00493 [Burkholderiaceae bacterium]|nr:hypothetical protein BURC_00493 [Burkholderiaceae bacterium]